MEISTKEFAGTLPEDYQARFNPAQIAAHAHAASERPAGRVGARVFPWSELHRSALCVVADDRPGLLSLISAALSELGFDVDAAEAYTRTRSRDGAQEREAVDLFWIRDPKDELGEEQADAFAALLEEHLAGRPSRAREAASEEPSESGTTVRFLEDKRGLLSVLEVETGDRSGLLFAITRALYRQDVQIVGSRVTTEGHRVHDRFNITELSGAAIEPHRRLSIQVAVISAVEEEH